MKLSRLPSAVLLVVGLTMAACAGAAAGPSDPDPLPSARVIDFTPDTLSPVNEAVAIAIASRAQEDGKIALAVTAHNLANHTTLGDPGIAGIHGRVSSPRSRSFPEQIRLRPFPIYAVPQNIYGGTLTIRTIT